MTAYQRQLEEKGYEFHGAYSWNKEEMKKRAAELRKAGHKAVVAYEPGSKLSRSGSGGGWSVYWIESEASIKAREAQHVKNQIDRLFKERLACEARIAEIDKELKKLHQS